MSSDDRGPFRDGDDGLSFFGTTKAEPEPAPEPGLEDGDGAGPTSTDAPGTDDAPPVPPKKAKKKRSRRRRVLWGVAWTLLVVLLAAAGLGTYAYTHLQSNLTTVNINQALGPDRPKALPAGAQDILILGSDSRAGSNAAAAGESSGAVAGARSDTAMVVHLPAGRKAATVISIPRDTLVDRPACTTADGRHVPAARQVMFNSIFSTGGVACTIKAVETITGLRMDHFVEIDFSGFKNLVDALGGVQIHLQTPIDDSQDNLHIPAGTTTLDGTTALKFVRTRYGIGDGSDLGRIQLQQKFLLSVLTQIQKEKSLSNPLKLYDIANAATKSITTDSGLGKLTKLLTFAKSLRGLNSSGLETIQLPVVYDPANPNRVLPSESQDQAIWLALRDGTPIPASAKKSPAHGYALPKSDQ